MKRAGRFSKWYFFIGAFVFLTAPLLLYVQSKYKGIYFYRKDSRQVRLHYLQTTVDVYTDRARRGGQYPEYSVLLIREFLSRGDTLSAETWLRYGISDARNPALAEHYALLIRRGILSVPHSRSFQKFLKNKAKEFRNL